MDAKVEPTLEVEPKARVFISYSRKDMLRAMIVLDSAWTTEEISRWRP